MPDPISLLALAIFQAGGPIWLANALVGVGALGGLFSTIGSIALSFGISALAGAIFRPKQQSTRPEDVQQSVRIAASDRVVIYGQYQATGNWIFGDSKSGNFHKVLAVCEGKLVTVINLKVDDNIATVDSNGLVTSAPYNSKARFQYRQGLPVETAFGGLTSVFPEWTSAHRGDGVVTIYATQFALDANSVTKVFPGLKDTLYRIEGRFTEIWNPITEVTAWSDNAAGIIRDFIVNRNGMRIPDTLLTTPLAQAAWETAWTDSNTAFALKGGGTEPRYRLWGAYKLSETPGSVLEAMLANCDAQPILTRDGGISIRIGKTPAPVVTLDDRLITAAVRVSSGFDIRTTANRISSKYLSKNDDYLLVDADPWLDDGDIAARGEINDSVDWAWSPSHSQARRLMKLRYHRLTPRWALTVNCRLGALAAFQERYVNVNYTIGATTITGVFEVLEFTWNIGDNGVLRSVTLSLQSIADTAYLWDPINEEGTAPVTADVTVDRSIPAVSNFNVTVGRRDIGANQPVAYAILTFDAPPSAALKVQIQGKKVSESVWSDVNVPDGATTVDGLLMDDNVQYEFQARHRSITGTAGDWTTPTIKVTPTADITAPGVVTSVTKVGAAGQVTLGWTTPNSANFSRVVIRRNTVNTFGTAVIVTSVYGAPNTPYTRIDAGLSAGTYFYWISAANASAVEAAAVATGSVTVT